MNDNKFFITIHSYNENSKKFDEKQIEVESKTQLARVILTYEPKRGYDIVNINIDIWKKGSDYYEHENQLEFNF